MFARFRFVGGLLLLLPFTAQLGAGALSWPDVRFLEVPGVGTVDFPVAVRNAGDGTNRLFVVERRGKIKVLHNGVLSDFLDISDRVLSSSAVGDEQGLLGLAFPPGFGTAKNHFYVYYTTSLLTPGDQILARFRLNPTVPPSGIVNSADPTSEEVVIRLDDATAVHNGGDVHFGRDGFLYLGLGDDGANLAQNPNELWGKLIRIDVESVVGTEVKFAVPADNPFAGQVGVRPEIWHFGLRNPWRWSFDRATGDMWIGDVGQSGYEEVNYIPFGAKGLNFGWLRFEGMHVRPGEPPEPHQSPITLGTLTAPVTEIAHAEGGRSVTGGYVYRGARFPAMQGIYIFTDFISNRLYGLQRENDTWVRQTLHPSVFGVASLGEDEQGELYIAVLHTNAGPGSGLIFQIGHVTDKSYLTFINPRHDPLSGRMSFHFGAAMGRSYQVQASSDLVSWASVGPTFLATDWTMGFEDPVDPPVGHGARFYRVVETSQ